MAGDITHNLLTSGGDSTNATQYTTASVAPASNELLLLALVGGKDGGAPNAPSAITGNGLTWVQMATKLENRRITLFRAMGASPSSGTIVIDFASTQTGLRWILSEFTGVDTTGSNGAGATNSDSNVVTNSCASCNSLTITLAAFSDAGNATFGAFGINDNANWTEGTGFTLISEASQGSPAMGNQTQWRNDNDTSVDVTHGSAKRIVGIAVEIFAAVAGVPGGAYYQQYYRSMVVG